MNINSIHISGTLDEGVPTNEKPWVNFQRQKNLLLIIIRAYIDAAQPIGSKRLVEHYHLDLPSATIRNEMSVLTDMGYLRQPHTSAGRVPTEEGYRYFVSQMINQAGTACVGP